MVVSLPDEIDTTHCAIQGPIRPFGSVWKSCSRRASNARLAGHLASGRGEIAGSPPGRGALAAMATAGLAVVFAVIKLADAVQAIDNIEGGSLGPGIWVLLAGAFDIFVTPWTSLPWIVWITIGYLAVFTTATTFFLVQFASLRLPASKVLSYGYLTPAFVILIEGVIGHGWASTSTFAGAFVIACALLIMALAPDQ